MTKQHSISYKMEIHGLFKMEAGFELFLNGFYKYKDYVFEYFL